MHKIVGTRKDQPTTPKPTDIIVEQNMHPTAQPKGDTTTKIAPEVATSTNTTPLGDIPHTHMQTPTQKAIDNTTNSNPEPQAAPHPPTPARNTTQGTKSNLSP